MELKGSHRFTAPPQAVWDALHNSALLQSNIPGAQKVVWNGDNSVYMEMHVGVGPVQGEGEITAQVAEQTAPTHMKLTFHRPGPRTPVSGMLDIDLRADGAGTLVSYAASATIGGPAAALDNPLSRPLVDGQLNQFLTRLDKQIP